MKISRALVFQIGCLAFAAAVLAVLAHHFDLAHAVERAQRRVGEMEWWGAVLYPPLVAACNLLLLPGSVLTLGGGLFFGLWWGSGLVLAGNVLGAAVAFGIGRTVGRGWVERRILRRRKWMLLDEALAREGSKIVFLSQVHPFFPTSFLNYFYGMTRIRFSTCMLWVALAQAPGIFLYAYLGTLAQLGIKLARHQTHPHAQEYVIWIGGLAVTLAATTALGRIALRLLAEAEASVEKARGEKEEKDAAPAGDSGGGSAGGAAAEAARREERAAF